MAKLGSRVEEMQKWAEAGCDDFVVTPPGLHNSDETLYELVEEIKAAGFEFPRAGWGRAPTKPRDGSGARDGGRTVTASGHSTGSQVRIGLQIPQGYFNEFDGWEPARAWTRILEISPLGERLGFESLWTGEHVLSKWGGPKSIAFDCFVLSGAIAAAVPKPDLGFDVVNSTFRNPALTAKMAATLDAVSGGRVILGLGCGFKPLEASTHGFEYPDMKERLALLGEHFEIITRILDNEAEPFSYAGRT